MARTSSGGAFRNGYASKSRSCSAALASGPPPPRLLSSPPPISILYMRWSSQGLCWYDPRAANHICQSRRGWCGAVRRGARHSLYGASAGHRRHSTDEGTFAAAGASAGVRLRGGS